MKIKRPTDQSALILPFGKHKGLTVAEVLATDPAYAEWVANQGWMAERFSELHAAIMSGGAASDDSPEHNAIQVRFLDETFRGAFLLAGCQTQLKWWKTTEFELYQKHYAKDPEIDRLKELIRYDWRSGLTITELQKSEIEQQIEEIKTSLTNVYVEQRNLRTSVKFEQRGVDVVMEFGTDCWWPGQPLFIEIKPTMGDDFPSVMRQMERLKCQYLVVGEYSGRAVSEIQLRQMFEANGRKLLFVRDIEAEIANARGGVKP